MSLLDTSQLDSTLFKARQGSWMQTVSGKQFWPLDPREDDIDINDIASALSKICRYGGHCLRFYSVAEHCVLMSQKSSPENALASLMHDSSEAYLSDIVRPVKVSLPDYKAIETRLERCIARKFNYPYPLPVEVKQLDGRILFAEKEQVMAHCDFEWANCDQVRPLDVNLRFWDPPTAELMFLYHFEQLKNG